MELRPASGPSVPGATELNRLNSSCVSQNPLRVQRLFVMGRCGMSQAKQDTMNTLTIITVAVLLICFGFWQARMDSAEIEQD